MAHNKEINIFEVYHLLLLINDTHMKTIIKYIDIIKENKIEEISDIEYLINDTIEKVKHMSDFYGIIDIDYKLILLNELKLFVENILLEYDNRYIFK